MASDIHLNPGPGITSAKVKDDVQAPYPCTVCSSDVGEHDKGVLCDKHDCWSHVKCHNISDSEYDRLSSQSDCQVWMCPSCSSCSAADDS